MTNINNMYFAVTNHYEIIPIHEVNRTIHDGEFILIETEIADKTKSQNEYYISQHQIKFKEMWLDIDNTPENNCVFMTLSEAISYATESIRYDIETKQSEIDRLNETLIGLNS